MSATGAVFTYLEPDDSARREAAIENLLLNGRTLDVKIAAAIVDIPFERDIGSASTVSLELHDPDGDLLNSGLFSAAVDIELPLPSLVGRQDPKALPLPSGEVVGYRLQRIRVGDPVLTLEFRERLVAELQRHTSPLKVDRAHATRAEFIRMMVREVKTETIQFWSPELHVKQPINTVRKLPTRRQKQNRRANGFGSDTPKVKGRDATRAQIRILEAGLETADSLKLPNAKRVKVGLVEAMTQESVVSNPVGQIVTTGANPGGNAGYRVNVGVMQQDSRYWPASRDISRDVTPFLQRLADVIKQQGSKHSTGWCVDQVQKSFSYGTSQQGDEYDQWEAEARDTVASWTGDANLTQGTIVSTEYRKRFFFRRSEPGQPRENSWDASGRLAAEVNWRRFADLGIFHYVSDDYLRKSAPRLVIDRSQYPDGIASVQVPDWDTAKNPQQAASAQITVQAMVDVLEPALGSVWIFRGWGPLDGRYLITNVRGSYLSPICTVTLELPTAALPEPAPDTGTRTRVTNPGASRSLQGTSVSKAYDQAWEIDGKRYKYIWGGGHGHAGRPDGGTAGLSPHDEAGTTASDIGYDCSGSVAAVLYAGGMLPKTWVNGVPPSGTFAALWGSPGEGEHMTVWANSVHVFIEFKNMTSKHKTEHFGTGRWGKSWGGPGFNPQLHPHAGFVARHWSGDAASTNPNTVVLPTGRVVGSNQPGAG